MTKENVVTRSRFGRFFFMRLETEQQLVMDLKQGSPEAFATVYHAYQPGLYGFLLRLTANVEVAEELLQETWTRLAARAPTLRDDTRLLPWLVTVARNLYLSYCRSRLLDSERVQELGRLEPVRQAVSPLEAAAAGELERRLEQALAALPVRYREAVLLVAVEGMTPSDAAAVCELNPAAFRQTLSRARAMLEETLARMSEPTRGKEGGSQSEPSRRR